MIPSKSTSQVSRTSDLEHTLQPHFPALAQFNSSRQMKASRLYRGLLPQIEKVMHTVDVGHFAEPPENQPERLRATAWNVERGSRLEGIVDSLQGHPSLRESDLLLLTEVDYGMARSGNRYITRDLAERLGYDYAFVNCYISLVKGSGLEIQVEGENSLALHGNALLSRHPMLQIERISLPNGKDKMRGKEKRLGCQQAVGALIDHPRGRFWAVTLHLDAHSSQRHRYRQMKLVLDRLDRVSEDYPVLIGGDWNTSTYNSKRAAYAILGYARRVAMGVENVIQNHYPHPDRWFERHLFRELERRGYEFRNLNQPGACTLHYDVDDLAINTNMGDWIPSWCFWFIQWALQRSGGKCSMKLDWFAGHKLRPAKSSPPRVVADVHTPDAPLSDHDPIVLDFHLAS